MTRFIHIMRLRWELSRSLATRKAEHNRRSQSAKLGNSTYWRNAGVRARSMFEGVGR